MKYSRLSLLSTRKTERGAIHPRSRSAVRAAPFALLTVVVYCASGLMGQTGREAYRQAYDAWQQAQANLERDAGTGGTAQVAQADRARAAASNFEGTRAAYLKSSAQDEEQRRRVLQTTATSSSPDLTPPAVAKLAAGELQTVTRAIAKFADDKDPAIQQLRQSLERERVALTALNQTIQARQKTVAATVEAAAALEPARVKTAKAFSDEAAQLSQMIAQMEIEGATWAQYYDKLAQAIQVANAPPPPAPVEVTTAAPPKDAILPPVPLARYVGSWTYPVVNGIFHGAQPESVDLDVQEQNGHVKGTLDARFKVPQGRNDPVVRLSFEGDLASTFTQKFTLATSDGTTGTIELIPGPAFNLLEVNFLAAPQTNKIRAANFILVKK